MQILDKITLLNRTTQDCLNEDNEIKIIERFTEVGLRIIGADFGFVWLKPPDSKKLELIYKSPNLPFEPSSPKEGGRNYSVIENSRPDFVVETKKTPDALHVNKYVSSFVIIPLVFKDSVYGTMVLCFKKIETFPDDKKILSMLIGYSLAQAINIGRLIEREHKARTLSERHKTYFKALVENSHEVIVLIDKKGNILYVSPTVKKIYGLEISDLVGNNISNFVHGKDSASIENYLARIVKNNNNNLDEVEFSYKNKEGNLCFVESTAFNMLDNPDVNGIILNIHDITLRKKNENLKQTEILLNEEKLKTEFIANATHEIRTPLAIIRGNVDLAMMKNLKDVKFVKDIFKAISCGVEHLTNMLTDLTMLSSKEGKIKMSKMLSESALVSSRNGKINDEIIFEKLDIFGVIKRIADRFTVVAGKKNILIEVKNKPSIYLMGDELYLEKLFANLIKNAITYGKGGGKIAVDFIKKENTVDITVWDNGIGISKDDLPNIFERFYRADKAHSSDTKNIGLGLALVKWIVTNHGGTITVESQRGKDTVFTVSLPILNLD